MPGPGTDPAFVERMRALIAGMGQVPIVLKKFISGYIANRIQSAITLEVLKLLDEGYATAREIDDAIIHGLSLRIPILGHLAKADFTGIELVRNALANRTYDAARAARPVGGRRPARRRGPHRRHGRQGLLRLGRARPLGALPRPRPPAAGAEEGDARDRAAHRRLKRRTSVRLPVEDDRRERRQRQRRSSAAGRALSLGVGRHAAQVADVRRRRRARRRC